MLYQCFSACTKEVPLRSDCAIQGIWLGTPWPEPMFQLCPTQSRCFLAQPEPYFVLWPVSWLDSGAANLHPEIWMVMPLLCNNNPLVNHISYWVTTWIIQQKWTARRLFGCPVRTQPSQETALRHVLHANDLYFLCRGTFVWWVDDDDAFGIRGCVAKTDLKCSSNRRVSERWLPGSSHL